MQKTLDSAIEIMRLWHDRADSKEKLSLVAALHDHLSNLAYCFKCADPLNKEHCLEIDRVEEWFSSSEESEMEKFD